MSALPLASRNSSKRVAWTAYITHSFKTDDPVGIEGTGSADTCQTASRGQDVVSADMPQLGAQSSNTVANVPISPKAHPYVQARATVLKLFRLAMRLLPTITGQRCGTSRAQTDATP